YTVTLSGVTGDGTVQLTLLDFDTITDSAGNPLGGTGTSSFTGELYTVDHTPPTVQSITRGSASPTGAPSVTYTVTFLESVIGVDASDFKLVTGGNLQGASILGVIGSGRSYIVTVATGSSGDGTLELDLVDDDSIKDLAGNPLGGSGGVQNGNF